jgi:hypothetical protein
MAKEIAMLILMLAALSQDAAPVRGPYVDLSTGANRIYADMASIQTRNDRVRLTVTVHRPDGYRSERDYWFDCHARTYSSATWRALNEDGEVEMHGHSQMRPAYRPVGADLEPFRALACDGEEGGRPILSALPR